MARPAHNLATVIRTTTTNLYFLSCQTTVPLAKTSSLGCLFSSTSVLTTVLLLGMPICAHSHKWRLQLLLAVPVSWQRCRKCGTSHCRLVCNISYSWGTHDWWPITLSKWASSFCHEGTLYRSSFHINMLRLEKWGCRTTWSRNASPPTSLFINAQSPPILFAQNSSLCSSQRLTIPLHGIAQTLHQSLRLRDYHPLNPPRHSFHTPLGNPSQSQKPL